MKELRILASTLAGARARSASRSAPRWQRARTSAKPAKAHYTPAGLCLLKDVAKK